MDMTHVDQLTDLLERPVLGHQNNNDVTWTLVGTTRGSSHSLEKGLVSFAQSGIGTNSRRLG